MMYKKIGVLVVGLVIAGSVFFISNMGKENPVNLEYSNLSLTAENRPINSPLSFEFEEDKFFTGKIKLSVDITNPRNSEVTENVKLIIDDSPSEGDNGAIRDNKRVELKAGQTKTVTFVISESNEGNYIGRIGESSKSFQVVNPATNPVLYPDYYYGVAKDYIPREYEVPPKKDINGLVNFLNQIEMPPYSLSDFKCTHSSVMLEWLLEGAGFNADLAVDLPENKKEGKYNPQKWEAGHSWVMVDLENRDIAIESELLGSSAWAQEGSWVWSTSYEPPGIMASDNYLRKHSIEMPDLSHSYYYDNIDNRYSSPKEVKLSYFNEGDYDWWITALNHPGIKSTIHDVDPFSKWVRK